MRLLRRLAYWLRLPSHHADLMDEVAFHREMIEQKLIQGGKSPEAARMEARRTMGNATLMREESRAIWVRPSLEALWQDAAYTLRDLRRNPIFTMGVTLTLALGIGANAAMFSLVDRLLFRPPARMVDAASVNQVYMWRTVRGEERGTGPQYVRYGDMVRWSTAFSQIATFTLETLALGVGQETQVRSVAVTSASFFDFFDAPPTIGRYFTAAEDAAPDPAPVAVLSHALWTTQYGSRRDVLGTKLHIDAVSYTIIGVAPPGFVGLWPYRPPAAFIPLSTYAKSEGPPDWATTYGHAIGLGMIVRRKPNVTITAASADLTNALQRSYQAQYSRAATTGREVPRARAVAASVLTERRPTTSTIARAAKWLSGVSVIVLLIAAANVANLLLARTIRRRREIAVRVALGVSRRRLFAQLLTEGVMLAILGGAAGVVIAVWGSRVLSATFLPGTTPVSLLGDARTLLFAGAVALGVGVLTGLAPMTQVSGVHVTDDLKSGAREGTYQRGGLRTMLLLLQSALSVVLLVGAGLFVQSLRNVRDVRLGFDPDPVLQVSLNMRDVKLDSAATVALRMRLLASAQHTPGVAYASFQESVPFGGMWSYPISVAGIDSARQLGEFDFNTISPDYFKVMGTRILRGRAIESTDTEGGRLVMVVGESMAKVLWPGQDPIGHCVRVGIPAETAPCRYVVGVAEDIHSQSIDPEPKLFFYYMPSVQWQPQVGGLFVRVSGDAQRMAEAVRRSLQRDMPGTSYVSIKPLGDIVNAKLRSWIVGAKVFTAFGALALLLAAVGLYSVIAYNVTQRRHELGVRLALGASGGRILRLVLKEGVLFAAAGVAIGSAAAYGAGRWIAPLLFKQSPRDPSVFAVVTGVLLAVAIVASWVPAIRAARLDPKAALQAD